MKTETDPMAAMGERNPAWQSEAEFRKRAPRGDLKWLLLEIAVEQELVEDRYKALEESVEALVRLRDAKAYSTELMEGVAKAVARGLMVNREELRAYVWHLLSDSLSESVMQPLRDRYERDFSLLFDEYRCNNRLMEEMRPDWRRLKEWSEGPSVLPREDRYS